MNEEPIIEKLLIQMDGIVIPSAALFGGELKCVHFGSGWELCDSISGDLLCAYETLADMDGGLKKSILIELDIDEFDSYTSEIAIIQDINYTDVEYLNTYLKLFDAFKDGLPVRTCQIIAVLFNVDVEKEAIKAFLNANWKLKNVNDEAVVVYRKN